MKNEKDEVRVIGQRFEVDFGDASYRLHFIDETQLHYKGLGGLLEEATVEIQRTRLRQNLYLVTWQEEDKTTVTHVQDFKNMVIYSNITATDNIFIRLQGTVKAISPTANEQ